MSSGTGCCNVGSARDFVPSAPQKNISRGLRPPKPHHWANFKIEYPLQSDSKACPAVRALDQRLPGIDRDQGRPEEMHICPRAAGLENDQLPTAWALPHAFAGPIIVAHDLAGAEE